jgi:hypothetical protein
MQLVSNKKEENFFHKFDNFEELSKELETYYSLLNETIKIVELLNSRNGAELLQVDGFMKNSTGFSPLQTFGVNLKNHYFIPTELGKIVGKSPHEINLILEKNGLQEKVNGNWKQTEKGKPFGIVLKSGSFEQIKWRLEVLEA